MIVVPDAGPLIYLAGAGMRQDAVPTSPPPPKQRLDTLRSLRTRQRPTLAKDRSSSPRWCGLDCFNNRRLLGPIGDIPPVECEAQYYAQAKVA